MADRDYFSTTRKLVELLDEDRRLWLESAVKLLKQRWPIVNAELSKDIDLGSPVESTMRHFSFESISGENIEALLIGWQRHVATEFAVTRGYINNNMEAYIGGLMKASSGNNSWLISFRMLLDDEPPTLESVPLPLAHYLMNTIHEDSTVREVANFLLEKNPLFGVMAQRSTAIAFDDIDTANSLSAAIGFPGVKKQNSNKQGTPTSERPIAEKKSRCFIATAACGEAAPEVQHLSQFRDNYLTVFTWGRRFIRAYYLVSPDLAKVIKGRPTFRAVARILIVKPAVWISIALPRVIKPRQS